MEVLEGVETLVKRVKKDPVDLKGIAQMDHQVHQVTKEKKACLEILDLREPQEKKVNSVVIVHHLLVDPQGTLALLEIVVEMDLLDHLAYLGQKVTLVLQELMGQVEILEARVSKVNLEIQALEALKVKKGKFSALKVPKVRRVNQALRDS